MVRYKGAGVNVGDITGWIDNLLVTSVNNDDSILPENPELYQNFPNPFNPITKISFMINKSQNVNLEIFDVTGKLVRKLVDNIMNAGRHELFWDGKDSLGNEVNSGIYFYKLQINRQSLTRKMTLLR